MWEEGGGPRYHKPMPDSPSPLIVYGHRGARGEAPENTLPGFRYAYHQAGLRAFELDIRLTADHRLTILHDASLARTAGVERLLADLTADDLKRTDARVAFPDWPEPCPIPLLDALFAELPPDVHLALEIKRDNPARLEILGPLLVELIARFGLADRVTVTSFDPEALRIVRRLAPELPRGFIGAYDTPAFLETALALECVQADIPLASGSAERVAEAHAHGLRVIGWPGNTPEQLATLLEWGVEGTTTDMPGVALPYLREHGRVPAR